MLGIFSKSKAISTRLGAYEQEQFLAHVKLQKRSVADVLREAVIFYLDNYEKLPARLDQQTRTEPENKKLLALDYDEEPRPGRWKWGG